MLAMYVVKEYIRLDIKSKEFGRPGGGVRPSRPPLDPPMYIILNLMMTNLYDV